jgi:ABC-type sugar transport system permease subunit
MRSRAPAWIVIIAGAVFLVAGVATYIVVSVTLGAQNITVSEDASMFAGQHVTQPWQAYAQANVINEHALEMTGGKTYAELPRDDPNRTTVMTASFLQASLFTSVVAFGVAAMAAVLGVLLMIIGRAILPPKAVTRAGAQPAATASRSTERAA